MSIKYKLIPRKNPTAPEATPKIYASPSTDGQKSIRDMGQDIADISSLSYGDVTNVLENFILQIPKYLKDGHSVSLGALGSLRLSFSSVPSDTEEDFTVSKIKNVKVIFRSGKELKANIDNLHFDKIDNQS